MRQLLNNLLAVSLGLCAGVAVSALIQAAAGLAVPPPGGEGSYLAGRLLASMAVPAAVPTPALLAAHAAGTFCAAAVTARLAASHALLAAIAIGFAFLSLGIANVLALQLPPWFQIADLNLAYIPMAWLGWRYARLVRQRAAPAPAQWAGTGPLALRRALRR
jgi:hypothetical protein